MLPSEPSEKESKSSGIPPHHPSPGWGSTTKLVVGLTLVAILAAMLIQFRFILGPLLLAFVLAYLLNPLVGAFSRSTHISWKGSVNLIFLALLVILVALVTLLGLAIIQQAQSLYRLVQDFIVGLPDLVTQLSSQKIVLRSIVLVDFSQLNLSDLVNQVVPNLQTPLSQIGLLITSFASGTLGTVGWSLFVLVISYFLLSQTNSVTGALLPVEFPGYAADIRRFGYELRKVWNAFLRGQLTVVVLIMVTYLIVFLILGIRYSLALALLTGLARFIPYLGPITVGIIAFLVAFFQDSNYFGLEQWFYAGLIVLIMFIVDQVFDQLVSPRILGERLGVHPAALLVTAIIAANLFGIIGLVLAAPVLATLTLISRYVFRKMLDLDPFPPGSQKPAQQFIRWARLKMLWHFVHSKFNRA
jgi:predicted PurR-regulated permease PerM